MVTEELKNYVTGEKAKGVESIAIASQLKAQGWDENDIAEVTGATPTTQPVQPTPVTQNGAVASQSKNDSLAPVSLILGIIGLVGWFLPIVGLPVAIIGIVFGVMARKSHRHGVAVAGIIVSTIAIIAMMVSIGVGIFFVTKLAKQITDTPTTSSSSSATPSNRSVYTSKKYLFSLTPPSGWTTKEGADENNIVSFFEPMVAGKVFLSNINVVAENVGYEVTLDAYVVEAKKIVKEAVPNFTYIGEKIAVMQNGATGTIVESSYPLQGLNIHSEQLMVLKNGIVYIISAASPVDEWSKNKATIEDALTSFTI